MSPSAEPAPIPADLFAEGDFVEACRESPDSLVYFLMNVGDGDLQVVLLPADPQDPEDTRRLLVVDVAVKDKLPKLILALHEKGLLPERSRDDAIPVVVGTHPHDDHIGGMPQFLTWFRDHVVEYWDSGYYHPTATYVETMVVLEELRKKVIVTQPTSGMTRYLNTVKLTTVTPGVGLRARYDTLGVNINDASISVKIEFPASRIVQKNDNNRGYARPKEPWAILLGADAQHTAWAQATIDFPLPHTSKHNVVAREAARAGPDWLRAHVFKVPHHASKHGLNVELVERIRPKVSLISSVGGGGRYGFPHYLAVEALREGVQATTSGQQRSPDHELGIFFTADRMGSRDGPPLGTIALVLPPKRNSKLSLWRFGDGPRDDVDLGTALRFQGSL